MSTAGKPGELHPRKVANDLGLSLPGGELSWAQVLDAAVCAYWDNRPEPECGTYPGYLRHLRRGERPCGPCKTTRAKVAAVQRRRRVVERVDNPVDSHNEAVDITATGSRKARNDRRNGGSTLHMHHFQHAPIGGAA